MPLNEVLRELVALAVRAGLEVRFDAMDPKASSRGGSCTLRGRRIVVVDRGAPLADQVAVVVAALAEVEMSAMYVPSILRRRASA